MASDQGLLYSKLFVYPEIKITSFNFFFRSYSKLPVLLYMVIILKINFNDVWYLCVMYDVMFG